LIKTEALETKQTQKQVQ